jgi:hypothetical protein
MNIENSEVVAEIKKQLAWRGPGGRPMGHVVLDRASAEILIAQIGLQTAALQTRTGHR